MSSEDVSSVEHYAAGLKKLLFTAHGIKPQGGIEPPLIEKDFNGSIIRLMEGIGNSDSTSSHSHYAAIETACRNLFYELLATTSINDTTFSQVWNLLDIVSIFSDTAQCEPGLVFWLVEELLDSQTIEGCRRVFDYLDSRRERITAKHFKEKKLIILRACNELLRRLSRAEDTVFCGRVFIFLFQSFPLGDKSSVNLRGEFHTENTTVYEKAGLIPDDAPNSGRPIEQVIRNEVEGNTEPMEAELTAQDVKQATQEHVADELVQSVGGADNNESNNNDLYPIFWALQETFSAPTKAFDDVQFDGFKRGLEATIAKFQSVQQEMQARGTSKVPAETTTGTKRKRNGFEDNMLNIVNPKYLTSKDLFDLEISDLAFRRHILVQALILIDFLLSLTAKSKTKLESLRNKSVIYAYTLSEENAQWALKTRAEIASYLQQGLEGKFYYRMVDTVLSRDKNWVHWKAENCLPIEQLPVPASDFEDAKAGAQVACANKKLKAAPIGSLDLKFLSETEETDPLADLRDPQRSSLPPLESFKRPLADDDFSIEMTKDPEERERAVEARASRLWRALRLASRSKLQLFDQIEDGNKLDPLFDQVNESKKVNGVGVHEENGQDGIGADSHEKTQETVMIIDSLEIPQIQSAA